MRVMFSNKTDEAKHVIKEDTQNNKGWTIDGGYNANAILEPIGIAFLEDIFSALESGEGQEKIYGVDLQY